MLQMVESGRMESCSEPILAGEWEGDLRSHEIHCHKKDQIL